MNNDLKLTLTIDASTGKVSGQVDKLQKSLKGLANQSKEVGQASKDGFGKMVSGGKAVENQIDRLKKQLVAYIGISQTLGMADEYKSLSGQIALVTNSYGELISAQKELQSIATETRGSLSGITKLYSALTPTFQEMGYAMTDSMSIIDLYNKSLALTSPTATESASATLQFAQAMGSGVLRGEEFNSIMENGRGVALMLAEGLGVPISALRGLAEAGQLTSDLVVSALETQADVIEAKFAQIPLTVGQSFQVLKDHIMVYVGELDESTHATAVISQSIMLLATNVDTVAEAIGIGLAVYAVPKAITAYAALNSTVLLTTAGMVRQQIIAGVLTVQMHGVAGAAMVATTAMRALLASTLAFMATPWGAAITAAAAAVGYLVISMDDATDSSAQLVDKVDETNTNLQRLKENADGSATALVNLQQEMQDMIGLNLAAEYHQQQQAASWLKQILADIAQLESDMSKDALKERVKIQDEINDLTFTEAEKRQAVLSNLYPENVALQQKLFTLQDITKEEKEWLKWADKELDTIEKQEKATKDAAIARAELYRQNTMDAQWDADNREFDKLDAKDALLEKTRQMTESVNTYGDAWTRTGNQAIDAMNSMVNALSQVNAIDVQYAQQMQAMRAAGLDQTEEFMALEKARAANSIKGTNEMLAASVAMFEEGSDAQRAAHTAYLAMTAVELAMNAKKALSNAVLAVTNQGQGDPYTAIPRMLAAGALVSAVLSQIGQTFSVDGGGSISSSGMRNATPNGKPLGSSEASQSLANSIEYMRDIEADQFNELRGIYNEMVDLNSNISAVTASLYRTGDLSGLGRYAGDYKYQGEELVNTLSGAGIHNALESLPGIGGSLFEVANNFGAGLAQTIASGLFGSTKKSVSDYGLNMGSFALGNDLDLQKYTTIKTKKDGGWFGKSKTSYSTRTEDISGESERLLNLVFDDLRDGMIAAGEALDRNVQSQVNGFVVRLGNLSTKGKSGDDIADALNKAISAQSDKLAFAIFDDLVRAYGKLNEGAMETVYRLVTDKSVTGNLLSKTNQSWGSDASGVAADAIAVSQALIGLAGSLKDLQSAGASYYDNFFSDAEKQADNLSYLTEALAAQNLALPENADAYKRLVESLNLGTAAAQSQYYTLLDLNEVAAQYYEYQAQQNDAYKSDLLEARVNLLKDEASAIESTISELKNLYSVLDSTYSTIIGSVTPDQVAYTNAQTTVADALASAKLGNFPDVSDISDALTVLANNNASNYANYSDYEYDQLMSANMIQELMGYTSDQITVEDQMLDQLTTQIDYLSEIANNTADYTVMQVQAAIDGSHATGLAYVPKDGYRAELHQGESVIDATTMKGLRKYGIPTSNGNANLIAEIRRLEQSVSKLSSENKALLNSIKSNTEKSFKLHREWDFGGIPETRQLGVSNV